MPPSAPDIVARLREALDATRVDAPTRHRAEKLATRAMLAVELAQWPCAAEDIHAVAALLGDRRLEALAKELEEA